MAIVEGWTLPEQTITVNNPILFEAGELLDNAEIVIDQVVVVDGKQYIVGSFDTGRVDSVNGSFVSRDEGRQFMVAIDESLDFSGLNFKAKEQLLQSQLPDIMRAKVAQGMETFFVSPPDGIEDLDEAAKFLDNTASPRPAAAPSPEPEAVPEPEAAAAPDRVEIKSPALIEGIDMDGTKVDVVIDNVEYVDGKPFLSGSFTVDTPTGQETREFVMQVDKDALQEFAGLSPDDFEARMSDGGLERFMDDPNYQMVLSTGESFADRGQLIQDIVKIEGMTDIGPGPHVGLMAIMGQQDPNFVENFQSYLARSFDPDQAIKSAVMDAVGITDDAMRQRLMYGTGGLDDFAQRIKGLSDPLEHKGVFDVLDAMGDQVRQARIAAEAAEAAQDTARAMDTARSAGMLADAARAAKWGAKVAGVGIAIGVGSTAMAAVAQNAQIDLAQQLTDMDPPLLSEEALEAYKEMMDDVFGNTVVDNTLGTIDQIGVTAIVTIAFEARAQAKYQDWLDKYAPDLPPDYVDAMSPTSFDTQNAQMDMLDEAIEALPDTKEGVPEGMHALIDASNAYRDAQQELVDMTRGKPVMSSEENQAFMEQAVVRDEARDQLLQEMHKCMTDPENIREFLELLPVDDRLEFVRRLMESEENKELMTALHPEVAAYIEAYDNSGLGYYFVGLDEEEFLKEHMEHVSEYIMERAGLIERPEPDLDEIRETIDQMMANGGIPEDAPPEFKALAELQVNPEMQKELFDGQVADGMVLVAQIYAEENYVEPSVEPKAALIASTGYDQAPAQSVVSPS